MLACGRQQSSLPDLEKLEKIILFPWNVVTLESKKDYFGPRVFEAQVGFLLRILLKKNMATHMASTHN